MGLLVEGVWRDDSFDAARIKDGRFNRPTTKFRNWITPDGSPGPSGIGDFPAEPGRYHLYVSLACPWAHRTIIFRQLKQLTSIVSMSVTSWHMGENGWTFDTTEGSSGDGVNGKARMSEIYLLADPKYTGRVSVPVLWDKKRKTIVSNELSEIIRMLNSAFDAFTNEHTDYYPADLRREIDAVNELVYANVNNGVYRTGFATTQQAYEDAFRNVFAALGELERRLSRQRYVAGARMTEADWRLFPTLVRFDAVYYSHFKCNLRRIVDFPQSVELSARSLSDARRRRDRQPRPHQAALLRQPAQGEPDRHRAARPGARFRRAARPRPVRELRFRRNLALRVPGAAQHEARHKRVYALMAPRCTASGARTTLLPPLRRSLAVQRLGDAGARARRGVGRQRIEREKSVLGDLVVGDRRCRLPELPHHIERDVIAHRIARMEIDAVQFRRPGQFDIALLAEFARQRLEQRLARLHPAAREMPAAGIGVLDQENPALAVEHQAAHPEREPAGKPPVDMHHPVERKPPAQTVEHRPAPKPGRIAIPPALPCLELV